MRGGELRAHGVRGQLREHLGRNVESLTRLVTGNPGDSRAGVEGRRRVRGWSGIEVGRGRRAEYLGGRRTQQQILDRPIFQSDLPIVRAAKVAVLRIAITQVHVQRMHERQIFQHGNQQLGIGFLDIETALSGRRAQGTRACTTDCRNAVVQRER